MNADPADPAKERLQPATLRPAEPQSFWQGSPGIVVALLVAGTLALIITFLFLFFDDEWLKTYFDKILFSGFGFSIGGLVSLVWGKDGLRWPDHAEVIRKTPALVVVLLVTLGANFWWNQIKRYNLLIAEIHALCANYGELPLHERLKREIKAVDIAGQAQKIRSLPAGLAWETPCAGR